MNTSFTIYTIFFPLAFCFCKRKTNSKYTEDNEDILLGLLYGRFATIIYMNSFIVTLYGLLYGFSYGWKWVEN